MLYPTELLPHLIQPANGKHSEAHLPMMAGSKKPFQVVKDLRAHVELFNCAAAIAGFPTLTLKTQRCVGQEGQLQKSRRKNKSPDESFDYIRALSHMTEKVTCVDFVLAVQGNYPVGCVVAQRGRSCSDNR